VSRAFSVSAKKSLSQNFLMDEAILHAIVDQIHPQAEDRMIEIGPGTGALTEQLSAHVPQLTLIELDDRLITPLRQRFPQAQLFHQDVLSFDFAQLFAAKKNNGETDLRPFRIVGNLPYQISTPLLFKLLESSVPFQDLTFLLQKEVVDRLVATPSHGEYGRLSVMIQAYFDTQKLLDIGPEAFHPSPKVDSALVRLIPRTDRPADHLYPVLIQVTQAAFNQRRKTLRNSLKTWQHLPLFSECAIDAQQRAENLSVYDYLRIAHYVHVNATSIL
jgi:16S rRNA (adenine1518-N6/adenine1519-N6)-dimethyltransferase